MTDFAAKLSKYADLAATVGVNVQPGQTLVVNAPIAGAEFVRLITAKAYALGASLVKVNWSDEFITRQQFEHAAPEVFTKAPTWFAGEMTEFAENGAAFLNVIAENPDALKGIDPERIANFQKTRGAALKKYRELQMSDKVSWSIVAIPSQAWADKVFPDAPAEERVDKLWEAIFRTVRLDREDPVAAWQEHLDTLEQKADVLNAKKYKSLHYIAPGTDLTIELPKGHLWAQGDSINAKGHSFVANMPTEEVFTAPLKTGVNGTVRATKPLSYGGNIIDGFSITFENGRIISVSAEKGQDSLEYLIGLDEGAKYLGEVALVPHKSPISESNILYFNTLFDENASNHLAIGTAYAFCLEGGKEMTEDQLVESGLNTSVTHVDFMIGSGEMDIYGINEDGSQEPVFLKGNWAF
ncbi:MULTISPECIES: aminopeptidase [unclassified Paenibacillus]|uniref:aminopeptidase n=1 Tax=unclassified Paenibacillus TaxID=185978 RepID=UPI0024051A23|nr:MULTISPECIES: aminopeptidase [unclassified Paenibacillus]MDF9841198.1 aminopeptidase [Paenibacillus sp. PastF-2]MDF9847630.1 aminopeptidase [Paenibacillus sp. PastM-2]MDF9854199.1 aminopeptidase [Paenibacillus sp. PastF-1]MDH6479630.1 aminopeptidase [Paenibacillus sp. PastH-2]MDH6505295.1 aminopeptidase [Paenibacillus sp. PastM-3]